MYQGNDTWQIVILYFKTCSTVLFCCCNSRAVSLTSVLDKLSVVIMKNRIKRYMNIYDTLQKSQHHLCRGMPHLASLLQSNHQIILIRSVGLFQKKKKKTTTFFFFLSPLFRPLKGAQLSSDKTESSVCITNR